MKYNDEHQDQRILTDDSVAKNAGTASAHRERPQRVLEQLIHNSATTPLTASSSTPPQRYAAVNTQQHPDASYPCSHSLPF